MEFNGVCRVHATERRRIDMMNGCLFDNVRFRTSDSHFNLDVNGMKINLVANFFIGKNAWIAEDVYVSKGVSVGEGGIVGTRATVTRDLPSHSLCVGTPAKALRNNISWDERLI